MDGRGVGVGMEASGAGDRGRAMTTENLAWVEGMEKQRLCVQGALGDTGWR